jgi:hypothetical protein
VCSSLLTSDCDLHLRPMEWLVNCDEDATTEGQRTLYGFGAVYVFDVAQTEGKELPALTEVNGDVSGHRERLFKFVESPFAGAILSEKLISTLLRSEIAIVRRH